MKLARFATGTTTQIPRNDDDDDDIITAVLDPIFSPLSTAPLLLLFFLLQY
jgi:hypothetical protein